MADTIGWIGSIAFAICGFPQACECFKNKSAKGINSLFVGLWLTGEICYVISVLMKFGWVSWMMFNYMGNLFSIGVFSYYIIRDKKAKISWFFIFQRYTCRPLEFFCLFVFLFISRKQISGGYAGGVPPVPISNTEVKTSRADDTWAAKPWESRSLP